MYSIAAAGDRIVEALVRPPPRAGDVHRGGDLAGGDVGMWSEVAEEPPGQARERSPM